MTSQPLLAFGSEGLGVGQLQQLLIEAGHEITDDEGSREIFGDSTNEAVRAVQREFGLAVDGIVGPKTWHVLKSPPRSSFTSPDFKPDIESARPQLVKVLQRALGEIGTQETGDNEGPILKYGGNPGEPYCAYFVSWCYALAGYPFGKLASAYKILTWAIEHLRVLAPHELIEPGDLLITMRTRFRGHVAMAVAPEHDGKCSTVGANEGQAVRGNVRRRAACTAVVRPLP